MFIPLCCFFPSKCGTNSTQPSSTSWKIFFRYKKSNILGSKMKKKKKKNISMILKMVLWLMYGKQNCSSSAWNYILFLAASNENLEWYLSIFRRLWLLLFADFFEGLRWKAPCGCDALLQSCDSDSRMLIWNVALELLLLFLLSSPPQQNTQKLDAPLSYLQ